MSSFKNDLHALSKDPVDVAADFIGAVYKHALSVIESSGIRDYFHFCQKDFVLSVPAVWSDKAKDLTLKASTTPVTSDNVSPERLTISRVGRLPRPLELTL
jgi:hypothetical protein